MKFVVCLDEDDIQVNRMGESLVVNPTSGLFKIILTLTAARELRDDISRLLAIDTKEEKICENYYIGPETI